ncbi:SDR family NAD(P)-dependent oxidoreductase [Mycolicibacterium litorale]|uniref:SDR family NAD(P)-dependent oxidoreductase n=1 Tax=Mycolicibacterium litorale TaxID=758802 RepID=UPI003CEAD446
MKTAIVTGATRGIGRGIATELAKRGYGLTVTARNTADLESLCASLRSSGAPEIRYSAADLADRDAAVAVVAEHERGFGSLNALVLSGGVGTAGPIGELPARRFDKTFAVNVASAMAITQAALPMLRLGAGHDPAHGSRVIALASITGVYAEPNLAAYGAAKAALISLMETLNAEESAHGVMGTAIAPAFVQTDMSAWTTDVIPADSMIRVADIVAVVRMLLELGPTASIPKIVIGRSGTNGYQA